MPAESLMIIESSGKTKTIKKYVDSKVVDVMATGGHIRELSKFGMGFDPKTYEKIQWKVMQDKDFPKNIDQLAKKYKKIYLSTDPDREGEAIAWHVFCLLSDANKKKCKRIIFNEITKTAITEAFKNPRDLDQGWINSYLARVLLDRWIGYKLSRYVNKKVGGDSAGRVQSIALKLLHEKEQEIKSFVPEHWFNVPVVLKNFISLNLKKIAEDFGPVEVNKNATTSTTINFAVKEEAEKVQKSLKKKYKLVDISDGKLEKKNPPDSLKTSALLKRAINKLGMSAKQIEKCAQKLYEGVELGKDVVSLITYPRTDRDDFSETFLASAKEHIIDMFSDKYWRGPNTKKKKEKLVQGAHEGIRPTNLDIHPDDVKQFLHPSEHKLYELIWVYTLCSLMAPAVYKRYTFQFQNNGHLFISSVAEEEFDGYKKLMKQYDFESTSQEKPIDKSQMKLNEEYEVGKIDVVQVDKRPPVPYAESTLIEVLEVKKIGRPSTYSKAVNAALNRQYAVKESQKFQITDLGLKVSKDLEDNFSKFIHYDFTKNMEEELDKISKNKKNWKDFLDETFKVFNAELSKAEKTIQKPVNEVVEGRVCDQCEKPLEYKVGKKTGTKFIGCSGYPDCKFVEWIDNSEKLDKNCPDCSKPLTKRKNKWGNFFISCSGYPDCKYIENKNPAEKLEEICPDCGKQLLKKKNKWGTFFISCSGYPKCKFLKNVDKKPKEKNKSH